MGTAATNSPADLLSYTMLFIGVAASWVGIPTAGVLAGDGQLDLRLVILVAAVGAWTGGYVGYLIGARAGHALSTRPGRWRRRRQRAVSVGERFYRRWGPIAVFVTPTWVSGALRMPRKSFLIWNAVAASVSTVVAVFGAYAVATALIGQLTAERGLVVAAVVLAAAVTAAGVLMYRRHARSFPDRP
jgi:membrane-associated protein